jgi:NAD(P)-dependent dehydrogenase (short-subunit alcohol dehydrogenase family)
MRMEIAGKTIIVTGGAHGIGRALCLRFAEENPRAIVVADRDIDSARETANAVGGLAVETDVSREADIRQLVATTEERHGPIDLFCSNAGVFIPGGVEVPDEDWERILSINFRAHLYAARAALPSMLARGEGYLLQVVSAAGLLSQPGSAPYAVTKHAALALAEWLAMTHGDAGIKVSAVCPQGVRTRMLLGDDGQRESFLLEGALSVEEVAEAVLHGLAEERFLILPHPGVREYMRRRGEDHERWLGGMRKLNAIALGKRGQGSR